MPIAQGISKITVFKKQSGLGVPATGTGGQVMRREKSEFKLMKDSFENNEIVQHQQSTGVTPGTRNVSGSLSGVCSPNTYSTILASLLRKLFTATANLTGLSITVSGTIGAYTLTTTGLLAGGLKIGDVIRITASTGLAANCLNKNLLITALSATVATVTTINGTIMTTGSGTACTIAVPGKKSIVPQASHTREYYTVEEWYSDITRSELFTDVVPASVDIGLPANGNSTFSASFVGLNRTIGAVQILTTPTAATTTAVQTSVSGAIIVNGVEVANVNAASIKIDGVAATMGAVIGTNVAPDIQRGRVKVSGSITAFFENGVMSALFDASTLVNVVLVAANDDTDASDFQAYSMSAVKFTGDGSDDGEKGIMKTFPFTAEMNGLGGAALANDQTIISIQDSQAA
jgi:hypothetical protein